MAAQQNYGEVFDKFQGFSIAIHQCVEYKAIHGAGHPLTTGQVSLALRYLDQMEEYLVDQNGNVLPLDSNLVHRWFATNGPVLSAQLVEKLEKAYGLGFASQGMFPWNVASPSKPSYPLWKRFAWIYDSVQAIRNVADPDWRKAQPSSRGGGTHGGRGGRGGRGVCKKVAISGPMAVSLHTRTAFASIVHRLVPSTTTSSEFPPGTCPTGFPAPSVAPGPAPEGCFDDPSVELSSHFRGRSLGMSSVFTRHGQKATVFTEDSACEE